MLKIKTLYWDEIVKRHSDKITDLNGIKTVCGIPVTLVEEDELNKKWRRYGTNQNFVILFHNLLRS